MRAEPCRLGKGTTPRRRRNLPSLRRRLHMHVPPHRPRIRGRRRSARSAIGDNERLVSDQLHCQARPRDLKPRERRLAFAKPKNIAIVVDLRRTGRGEETHALGNRSAAHCGFALRLATDGTRRRDRGRRRQFPGGLDRNVHRDWRTDSTSRRQRGSRSRGDPFGDAARHVRSRSRVPHGNRRRSGH